ncbi:MAG TPA: hypothetical protein VK760_05390, partial [Candidatus Acidoferrales bacterium]|nr:hypothetical protein [Candidatus Acidoferrales bacterium]
MVQGFTIHDPSWRFVLDAREPAREGRAFGYYIDDPEAPKTTTEVFAGGETLDKVFCGELHVRSAMTAGIIRFEGDMLFAIRLIPAVLEVAPLYRQFRTDFVAASRRSIPQARDDGAA